MRCALAFTLAAFALGSLAPAAHAGRWHKTTCDSPRSSVPWVEASLFTDRAGTLRRHQLCSVARRVVLLVTAGRSPRPFYCNRRSVPYYASIINCWWRDLGEAVHVRFRYHW